MAQALVAEDLLRRFDIHDTLLPASLTRPGQIVNGGVRVDLEDLPFSAYRAHDPSVLYDQFTANFVRNQAVRASFFGLSVNIHKVSRIRNQYLK